MTISYNATVKNNRLTQVVNAVDAGAGSGVLVIGTNALSGGAGVLASIALAKPSGVVSSGVLTIAGTPLSIAASNSGQAAKAELRDSNGVVIASNLSVGVSAGFDIVINSTSIVSGQNVQLTSGQIQHS